LFVYFYLEINGADANEPPVYFIAFSGDSGNDENITSTFYFSSSSSPPPPLSSSSRRSITSSRKPITLSRKSTTTRTMLLQRKQNPNHLCNRQKPDCQTGTLSTPSN